MCILPWTDLGYFLNTQARVTKLLPTNNIQARARSSAMTSLPATPTGLNVMSDETAFEIVLQKYRVLLELRKTSSVLENLNQTI